MNDLRTAIRQLDKRDCALLHDWAQLTARSMHEVHHHSAARVVEALEASLDAPIPGDD